MDFLGSLDKKEQQKLFASTHTDRWHYCQTFAELFVKGFYSQTEPCSGLATGDITPNQVKCETHLAHLKNKNRETV